MGGKPGVNYELLLHVYKAKLVWCYGPIRPGKYNDVSTYRRKLKEIMETRLTGKRILGDKGYRGEVETITTRNPYDPDELNEWKDRALARHEKFNQLLKCWNVLQHRWRHGIANHQLAFKAVCAITQYELDNQSIALFDPYL